VLQTSTGRGAVGPLQRHQAGLPLVGEDGWLVLFDGHVVASLLYGLVAKFDVAGGAV